MNMNMAHDDNLKNDNNTDGTRTITSITMMKMYILTCLRGEEDVPKREEGGR